MLRMLENDAGRALANLAASWVGHLASTTLESGEPIPYYPFVPKPPWQEGCNTVGWLVLKSGVPIWLFAFNTLCRARIGSTGIRSRALLLAGSLSCDRLLLLISIQACSASQMMLSFWQFKGWMPRSYQYVSTAFFHLNFVPPKLPAS